MSWDYALVAWLGFEAMAQAFYAGRGRYTVERSPAHHIFSALVFLGLMWWVLEHAS